MVLLKELNFCHGELSRVTEGAQVIGQVQFRGQRSERALIHLAQSLRDATKLILTLLSLCFSSSHRRRRIDTFNADGGILVETGINMFSNLCLAFRS